jgi:chromosome segregation ATPase
VRSFTAKNIYAVNRFILETGEYTMSILVRTLLSFVLVSIISLSGLVVFAADKNKKAKDQKAELEATVKSLEKEIQAGRSEIDKVATEREDLARQNKSLKEDIDKAKKERDQLKKEYDLIVSENKKEQKLLNQRLAEQNKVISVRSSDKVKYEAQAEKAKKETQALAEKVKQREKDVDKAEDLAENKKDELEDLQQEREKLISEIARINAEHKLNVDQTESLKKEIISLKQNIVLHQGKFKESQKTKSYSQSSLAAVRKEHERWANMNKAEAQRVSQLEDQISDLQRMIRVGQDEIEKAKKENVNLLKRKNNAQTSKPELEAKLNRLKNEYKLLKERNRQLQTRT